MHGRRIAVRHYGRAGSPLLRPSGSAARRRQIGLLWERFRELVDLELLFSAVARERHPGARSECRAVAALRAGGLRFITAFASLNHISSSSCMCFFCSFLCFIDARFFYGLCLIQIKIDWLIDSTKQLRTFVKRNSINSSEYGPLIAPPITGYRGI